MEKYQSYKSSSVEWIGEIPEKWRVSKFKYVSKLYTGNSLNDEQKVLYESDDENHIPYVSSKDIDLNTRSVNYDNGLRIPKENNPLKVSPKDSFLLCVEGGSSGRKMVYLDREVCFVNKLCSFKSVENTRFQYYFIQSSNFQDKFRLSLSGLIGGVSISTLRDFELVLPSSQEQLQIVQFLDEKTELIDRLISTKERKITLLKEQRTSLINQVVTKGLNPNVKMKDSGVEWIGDIPENWNMFRVSNFGTFFKGSGIKKDEVKSEGLPCIRYGEIYTKYERVVYFPSSYIDEETSKNSVPIVKGDILFTGSGETIEDIGKSILYYGEENIFVGGDIIVLRLKKGLNPLYLSYLLNSFFIQYQKSLMGRGEIIVHIYSKNIKDIRTPLPPLSEQNKIVDYLDLRTKKIDDLVQLEQTKIDLLKEYRQSLISQVVTGKIKVTN